MKLALIGFSWSHTKPVLIAGEDVLRGHSHANKKGVASREDRPKWQMESEAGRDAKL